MSLPSGGLLQGSPPLENKRQHTLSGGLAMITAKQRISFGIGSIPTIFNIFKPGQLRLSLRARCSALGNPQDLRPAYEPISPPTRAANRPLRGAASPREKPNGLAATGCSGVSCTAKSRAFSGDSTSIGVMTIRAPLTRPPTRPVFGPAHTPHATT